MIGCVSSRVMICSDSTLQQITTHKPIKILLTFFNNSESEWTQQFSSKNFLDNFQYLLSVTLPAVLECLHEKLLVFLFFPNMDAIAGTEDALVDTCYFLPKLYFFSQWLSWVSTHLFSRTRNGPALEFLLYYFFPSSLSIGWHKFIDKLNRLHFPGCIGHCHLFTSREDLDQQPKTKLPI